MIALKSKDGLEQAAGDDDKKHHNQPFIQLVDLSTCNKRLDDNQVTCPYCNEYNGLGNDPFFVSHLDYCYKSNVLD